MKLGLGTVQFGIDYGISNPSGQTTPEEVKRILEFAADQGICYLDTAPAYGNSEEVLGASLVSADRFQVITKTHRIAQPQISTEAVERTVDVFRQSLKHLQQSSVYGLLVHHPDDLLAEGGDRLMASLKLLQSQGFVQKIGVSVYSREQIDRLLEQYPIDLLQVPLNVFDQRLLKDGYLRSLNHQGIKIHVRSAFLQGLLLMSEAELPDYLLELSPHLQQYRQVNQRLGISPLQAAIGFVDRLSEVDAVLVGVNNLSQLIEITTALNPEFDSSYLEEFAVEDVTLIDPSLWSARS